MRHVALVGAWLLLAIGGVVVADQAPGSGKSALENEADAWLYPKAKLISSAESGGRVY